MSTQNKSLFKNIFFIAGICYATVYLIACLTPYVNPVTFWPLTFLALGFVYLLAGMIVLFLLSLVIFRKRSWIFLLVLLAGYQNIGSVFGFHERKDFVTQKDEKSLRILSWNVNYFGDCQKKSDAPNNVRRQMFAFIQQSDADVLCLQDFSNFIAPWFYADLDYVRDSLHYPYVYFPIEYAYGESDKPEQYGPTIFSRLPLTDTGRIRYTSSSVSEGFQFATINFKGQPIKIFNAHLSSMAIHAQNSSPRGYNFLEADSGLLFHSNTFRKLKFFDKIHIEQAKLIKSEMDKTSIPFFFCGDLNSVPASYVYQHLRKNLSDAFLSTGFGFGGTYDSISPTLRIDVVLMDQRLKTAQHHTPHLHLSDHYPNLVDIQLR